MMQKIFEFAILFTPVATKDQAERGEEPKTELVVKPAVVLAKDAAQAQMLASRAIPDQYVDKLDQVAIAVRPF